MDISDEELVEILAHYFDAWADAVVEPLDPDYVVAQVNAILTAESRHKVTLH